MAQGMDTGASEAADPSGAGPLVPQRVSEPFVGRGVQLMVNASNFHRANP